REIACRNPTTVATRNRANVYYASVRVAADGAADDGYFAGTDSTAVAAIVAVGQVVVDHAIGDTEFRINNGRGSVRNNGDCSAAANASTIDGRISHEHAIAKGKILDPRGDCTAVSINVAASERETAD